MKNQFFACIVSAALGATLAIWWHDRPQRILGPATVTAQDRFERSLDLIDDTKPASRRPRRIGADLDAGIAPAEFSPEEQINISVYERVNRSVVNIITKSWSPEMFLMREPPSDGAGSGSVYDKEGHILTNDHVIAGASQVPVTRRTTRRSCESMPRVRCSFQSRSVNLLRSKSAKRCLPSGIRSVLSAQ
jgi:S1-C subfamily serine protease